MIEVSVVVPTYNRRNSLRQCLHSLRLQDFDKDRYEVIVVIDGSSDGTEDMLRELFSTFANRLVILGQENKGPAAACNFGVKNSRGRIIAFTEDDCVVERDWIKKIVYYHSLHPRHLAIQGAIFDFPQKALTALLEKIVWQDYLKYIVYNKDGNEYIYRFATGNCSVKKELFLKSGYSFPEDIYFREDADVRNQLLEKNIDILYAREIKASHKHRSNVRAFIKKQFRDGRGIFLSKRKWKKSEHFYKSLPYSKFGFFFDVSRSILKEKPAVALLLFCLYLIRIFARNSGYFYQMAKK